MFTIAILSSKGVFLRAMASETLEIRSSPEPQKDMQLEEAPQPQKDMQLEEDRQPDSSEGDCGFNRSVFCFGH